MIIGESPDKIISTRLTNISKLITSLPGHLPITLLKSCFKFYRSEFSRKYDYLQRNILTTEQNNQEENNTNENNYSNEQLFFICLAYQLTELFPTLQQTKDSQVSIESKIFFYLFKIHFILFYFIFY